MQLFGYYIDPVSATLALWAVGTLAASVAAMLHLHGAEERETRRAIQRRLAELDPAERMPEPYPECWLCEGAREHGPRVMQLHQKAIHGRIRWG